MSFKKKIFITGGSGYVGSVLTKYLINKGWEVTVFDLLLYGDTLFKHKNLKVIKGDIRDTKLLKEAIKDHEILIHLACISNDPSFELNPILGKEINLYAFTPLVELSKNLGVKRFIYASSSSVYGVKAEKNVNEEMKLEPLTDYSRYKAECEDILFKHASKDFVAVILRPATVCGYSPRQRLDLVVNILTNQAYHKREITIFGGDQLRPNIHIQDMVRAYELFVNIDDEKVNGKIFNVGFENFSVNQLALLVQEVIGADVRIKKNTSNDNRSYHISSKKIIEELDFKPNFSVVNAIEDLKNAFDKKLLLNCLTNENYFNIKKMQSLNFK
jgi:nucleoside-diphosphate-sugar epimerase